MRKNTLECQSYFLGEQSLTRQLKIIKERMNQNYDTQFQPPKDLQKLRKLLTFKNHKISNQMTASEKKRYQSAMNQEYLEFEQFGNPKSQLSKPFQKKDLVARFQQNFNCSDTCEILKINKQIRKAAQKYLSLENVEGKSIKIKNEDILGKQGLNQDQKSAKIFEYIAQNSKVQFLTSQQKQNTKKFQVNNSNQKLRLQRLNQVQLSVNQLIAKQLMGVCGKEDQLQVFQILINEKIENRKKVIMAIFTHSLRVNIGETELNDYNIFKISLSDQVAKYAFTYCSSDLKISSYSDCRAQQIIKEDHQKTQNQYPQHVDLYFWCFCLMLFFSEQKNKLMNKLEEQDEEDMIPSLVDFYEKKQVRNKEALKRREQFQANIFYRILIKIITNEELSQKEYNKLYKQEKQIIIFLKLRYLNDYSVSSEFEIYQNKMVNLLKVTPYSDKNRVSELLSQLLSKLAFDFIIFQFFLSQQDKKDTLQLLLLFKILLQKNQLLKFSKYPIEKWALKCMDLLQSFVQNQEFPHTIEITLKIMNICKKLINQKDFTQKIKKILTKNKLFLQNFIHMQILNSYPFITQLDLKVNVIQQCVLRSIQLNNQEFIYCISEFLSTQFIMEQNPNKKKNVKKLNQGIQDEKILNRRQIPKSQVEFNRISLPIYENNIRLQEIKDQFFIIGLKLTLRFLIKLICQNTLMPNQNERQNHINLIYQILKKAQNLAQNTDFTLLKERKNKFKPLQLNIPHKNRDLEKKLSSYLNSFTHLAKFFLTYLRLSQYRYNENPQIILSVVKFIQNLKLERQSLSLIVQIFCNHLKLFQLEDKSFIYRILSKYTQELQLFMRKANSLKVRKTIPSINKRIDFSPIIDFLQKSTKIIESFAELQQKNSIKLKKVDPFLFIFQQ